jgi:hypothetical protein
MTQSEIIAAPVGKPQQIQPQAQQQSQLAEVWRHAKMLSESDIVPQAFRGKPANCVIAVELAHRLGSAPMMVMQNLDIIQGKPSWSSKFLIATVNACGRFSPLRFRFDGKPNSKDWSCTAYATERETGEILEGITITMAMADAEGWLGKAGSKWKTMPQLMLTYRAAAFWARIYCPEVSMGLHTAEENEDVFIRERSGGMPDEIRQTLVAESTSVSVPELSGKTEAPAESSPDQREPGQEG